MKQDLPIADINTISLKLLLFGKMCQQIMCAKCMFTILWSFCTFSIKPHGLISKIHPHTTTSAPRHKHVKQIK